MHGTSEVSESLLVRMLFTLRCEGWLKFNKERKGWEQGLAVQDEKMF